MGAEEVPAIMRGARKFAVDEVGGLLRTHPGIGLPMTGTIALITVRPHPAAKALLIEKTSVLAISAGKTSVSELLALVLNELTLNELTLSELALREQKLNARN